MKRLTLVIFGLLVSLGLAAAVLAMFVVRPDACGEPAACADDYLFPALPAAALVLLSGIVSSAFIGRWDRPMRVNIALVCSAVFLSWSIVIAGLRFFS